MYNLNRLAQVETMEQFAAGGIAVLEQFWGQTSVEAQARFSAAMNRFLLPYSQGVALDLGNDSRDAKNAVAVEMRVGKELNVQFAKRVIFGNLWYLCRQPNGKLEKLYFGSKTTGIYSYGGTPLADDAVLLALHEFGPEVLTDKQVGVELLIVTYYVLARLHQFGYRFQHGGYVVQLHEAPTKAHNTARALMELLSQKYWQCRPRTDAEYKAASDAMFATLDKAS